ncbi:putative chitinase [Pseudomonas sp. GM50]|uniref:hypothetical protein n=1 Tax=Pseudomonas sp. GM50 TaxID=1144332 RepID=UPI0002707880|nr:hypothetical protein [Pseudomonas sp. GM50]EJM68133.1 putative chitinase [Pseudomonas sp. GM50]
MTETTSKVEKWSYPLKVGTAEATDPQQFYRALAKAKDGYYPLGANGLWHGGVHFDEDSGLVKDLTEVRCIADGEVVAYRIDEKYPASDFGSTHSVYSTGFVLVKHRLEVPVPPAPAPTPGAQPATVAPGPSLTFFSLYMHLLHWDTYEKTPALGRPPFWSGGTWKVKSTAKDEILGLRVRLEPRGKPGYATVLAVLPRGTVVETGEEENGWLKVVSVTPANTGVTPGTGWVFKRQLTAGATPNSYVIGSAAKDPMNPPQKGLAVHASASRSSATTAILPIGTKVKIGNDGTSGKYQKLLEIVGGNAVPPLAAADVLGYVWEGLLETKSEPAEKGTVHVLTRPFSVKAGSLIGHVGQYQNHSDSAPKNFLHLEVFSCEDVKAFTALSKEKVTGLPAAEKTMLKIPKGSVLVTHMQGMSATNPPKVTDPHKIVGYDFLVPVAVLEALPAEKRIKVPVVMGGATTYTLWWRLDGLLGDAGGNEISGWFAEPDTTLSRHSPFEWEGFSFIDETVSNMDHLAAFLHAQESLSDEERATYLPNVSNANEGSAKQQLYKILDKNADKKLTPLEIKEALGKPWFSQPISQMVTRYESEWQYKKDKWDALDELMGHNESDPHKEWVEEKVRIENLSWWDKLIQKHGITEDINIQHIHPIGLISNFTARRDLITLEMLRAANPDGAEEHHRNILPYLNKYALAYKLEEPKAIAHFLSQVGHESGFRIIEEGLRYSARQMKKTYGCRRQNNVNGYNEQSDSCEFGVLRSKLWSEESYYAMNAENLGSYVYANRMGNGDEASKEGYTYRGRGMLQVTGKSEYLRFTNVHNQKNPTDIQDFVANPDLLVSSIEYGVESAFVFWFTKTGQEGTKLCDIAKTGSVVNVTQMVNGGQNGYTDRNNRFQSLATLMNL